MSPSEGLGNANLDVIRDIYSSIHSLSLTLQCDYVHVPELSQPTSTNVTKRGQIDHGERVSKAITLLSREQGSFITISHQSIVVESEIGEGREI